MESYKVLQLLVDSRSPVALILVIGVITIVILKLYLEMLLKLRREEKSAANVPLKAEAHTLPTDAKGIVDANFKILERYYNQHLSEYRLMSRCTMLIASFGILVILIGASLVLYGTTSVGILTGVAGIVAEGTMALFLSQNKAYMQQIEEYHKKLVSTQYLLSSISLTDSLPDDLRKEQTVRIISNLLFLSNALHGAKNDNLFINTNKESTKT